MSYLTIFQRWNWIKKRWQTVHCVATFDWNHDGFTVDELRGMIQELREDPTRNAG